MKNEFLSHTQRTIIQKIRLLGLKALQPRHKLTDIHTQKFQQRLQTFKKRKAEMEMSPPSHTVYYVLIINFQLGICLLLGHLFIELLEKVLLPCMLKKNLVKHEQYQGEELHSHML